MQRKQLLRQIKITANEQIYSRAKLLNKYLLKFQHGSLNQRIEIAIFSNTTHRRYFLQASFILTQGLLSFGQRVYTWRAKKLILLQSDL